VPETAVGIDRPNSREDRLFFGFGGEAAAWWAHCNGFEPKPADRRPDGCVEYRGCAPGTYTAYCETGGAHTKWPAMNAAVLRFLANARQAGGAAPLVPQRIAPAAHSTRFR
jgi:hypothetical protein